MSKSDRSTTDKAKRSRADWQRETLDPPPRDYTDPDWLSSTTPDDVFAAIADGVANTAMPSWSFNFSDAEIWDLTTYVLSVAEHGAFIE